MQGPGHASLCTDTGVSEYPQSRSEVSKVRKFYEVRILRHLKGESSAFIQDSGYIQQIASSPRVAANWAWAGSVRDRHLSPDEEVTIIVRASEVTMDDN